MKALNRIMKEKGITQAELEKMTKIGRSSLSQYMNGKHEPSATRKSIIADALGVEVSELDADTADTAEKLPSIERLAVEDAAKIMGIGHETVRKGLQQGVFPWGYAVETSENRWTYYINRRKFEAVEIFNWSADTGRLANVQ